MKYRCLVLDHDDTVVNSTATIHYPAFVDYMKTARPGLEMSLEEYFALNFEPGVVELFRDICGLSEEEMKQEELYWQEYVRTRIPASYDGIREILEQFRLEGGLICLDSHSFSDYIRRDYAWNHLPEPDAVFGWDLEPEKRKPSPYTIFEIEKRFDLKKEEILVVDDLKPGYDMARAAGVAIAGAGWANDVSTIEDFMRRNCDYYFKEVSMLYDFLFRQGPAPDGQETQT